MLKSPFSWKAVLSLDLFHRTISVFAPFLGRLYRNLFRVAYLFFYHSNRAISPTRTATLNKVFLKPFQSLVFFWRLGFSVSLCAFIQVLVSSKFTSATQFPTFSLLTCFYALQDNSSRAFNHSHVCPPLTSFFFSGNDSLMSHFKRVINKHARANVLTISLFQGRH